MTTDEIKAKVPHKEDCKNADVWCYHHPEDGSMTMYRCESCQASVILKQVSKPS